MATDVVVIRESNARHCSAYKIFCVSWSDCIVSETLFCDSSCEDCGEASCLVTAAACISFKQSSLARVIVRGLFSLSFFEDTKILWWCAKILPSRLVRKNFAGRIEIVSYHFSIVDGNVFSVVWVSRRRSSIAVGSLYYKFCTGWCCFQRAGICFVAWVLAQVTTVQCESWQGSKKGRGLQDVCWLSWFGAFFHYGRWLRATAMLSQLVSCWQVIRVNDGEFYLSQWLVFQHVGTCWHLALFVWTTFDGQ